jgi:hypothetical protein
VTARKANGDEFAAAVTRPVNAAANAVGMMNLFKEAGSVSSAGRNDQGGVVSTL